jgi:N utilization substance protein B
MTSRRKTRELALSCCYEIEVGRQDVREVLDRVASEQTLDPNSETFLRAAVNQACTNQVEVDKIIEELAIGWKIDRIARVDLAILRLSIVELLVELEDPPPPDPVVINEAIVLAKKFSTADSGRFVNGILASVEKEKEKYRARLMSSGVSE